MIVVHQYVCVPFQPPGLTGVFYQYSVVEGRYRNESTEKGALVFFAGLNRVHLTLETAALMQQPNCSDDSRVLDQLQLERQGSSN
jgi:hypothetical protein